MTTLGGSGGFSLPAIPVYTGKNSKRNAARKKASALPSSTEPKSFVLKTHRENDYSSEEEEEEEEYRKGCPAVSFLCLLVYSRLL